MIDPDRYNITVRKTTIEGEDFFEATVRELPDLHEYGATYHEAFELALDAISTLYEMYAEDNRPFPEPYSPPEDYSGRVTLRMPKTLHRRLAMMAEDEDISLNQYILSLLAHNAGFHQACSLESSDRHFSFATNVVPFPVGIRVKKTEKSLAVGGDWDGN